MLLSLLHEHSPDVPHVPQLRALLYFVSDLRVLREYLLLQELFGQRVGTNFIDSHIDKLGLLVEANVVVADEGVLLQLDSKMMRLILRKSLCHKVVTNTDLSFQKEVHIRDLVLLVKDEPILLLDIKLRWLESEAYLEEEILIIYLISLTPRNEEGSEPENYIVE